MPQSSEESSQSADEDSPSPETARDVAKLAEVLEGELADDFDPDRRLRAVEAVRNVFHSGPLPTAEWFEGVEALAPGVTQSLVDDYLQERAHMRSLQQKALDIDEQTNKAASTYYRLQLAAAWSLAVAVLVAAVVLVATDHPVYGLAAVIVEVAAVTAAFFGRRTPSERPPVPEPDATQD